MRQRSESAERVQGAMRGRMAKQAVQRSVDEQGVPEVPGMNVGKRERMCEQGKEGCCGGKMRFTGSLMMSR